MNTTSAAIGSTPRRSATGGVLNNKDILDLFSGGLPSPVVVAKIRSSICDFDTSPARLKEVKAVGLSDAVLLAMVECVPETVAVNDSHPSASTLPSAPIAENATGLVHSGKLKDFY